MMFFDFAGGYYNEHQKALDLLTGLYEYCGSRDSCSECIFSEACEQGFGIFTCNLLNSAEKRYKELDKKEE